MSSVLKQNIELKKNHFSNDTFTCVYVTTMDTPGFDYPFLLMEGQCPTLLQYLNSTVHLIVYNLYIQVRNMQGRTSSLSLFVNDNAKTLFNYPLRTKKKIRMRHSNSVCIQPVQFVFVLMWVGIKKKNPRFMDVGSSVLFSAYIISSLKNIVPLRQHMDF